MTKTRHARTSVEVSGTVWTRMPSHGQRLEGLTRSQLYVLDAEGLIKTKALVKPGAKRGIRLVNLPSVRAYIDQVQEAA